jgi:uncharacterized protein YndB with AHSA1/START domain
MSRSIRVSRVLPFPIDDVWGALTDRDELREWFCSNDFEPRVGHEFTLRDKPRMGWDGVMHCEVLALEAPHRLSFSFKSSMLKDTTVTFSLSEEGEGTEVVIEHVGFSGFGEFIISRMLKAGWGSMLKTRLPLVLARKHKDVVEATV